MGYDVIQPGGTSVGGLAKSHDAGSPLGSEATNDIPIPIPLLDAKAGGVPKRPQWVYVCVIRPYGGIALTFGKQPAGPPEAFLENGIGISGLCDALIINVSGFTHFKVVGTHTVNYYTMTPLAGVMTIA